LHAKISHLEIRRILCQHVLRDVENQLLPELVSKIFQGLVLINFSKSPDKYTVSLVIERAFDNQSLVVYVEILWDPVVRCSQDTMSFVNWVEFIFGALSQLLEELSHGDDLCFKNVLFTCASLFDIINKL
jgi:hypothetical protein